MHDEFGRYALSGQHPGHDRHHDQAAAYAKQAGQKSGEGAEQQKLDDQKRVKKHGV